MKPSIAKFCSEYISFYKIGQQKDEKQATYSNENDYTEEKKLEKVTHSRARTTASFRTVSREEEFDRKVRLLEG